MQSCTEGASIRYYIKNDSLKTELPSQFLNLYFSFFCEELANCMQDESTKFHDMGGSNPPFLSPFRLLYDNLHAMLKMAHVSVKASP